MHSYDSKKYGVIIIGGHVQGLGISRIYGKQGIPSILLDNQSINLTRHSKYCKKYFKYSDDGLIDKLIEIGKTENYSKWLIIPTNDESVEKISLNKTLLEKYFKVSTSDFENLKVFYNKRLTYKLATSLGIDIPKTWIFNSIEEYLARKDLKFPCIIKPAVMHTFYKESKKKVFVCKNETELLENYKKAIDIIPRDEIIIQDIIPGDNSNQYSACFMFDGIKPLVSLTARRARQHPIDFGNATTYAETIDNQELTNRAIKILRSIGFVGVCEVEFKYDSRDNQYKFLEVNPRTWKWHSIAEKSNTPILMSMYNFFYNYKPIVQNTQVEAAFRHLITDIPTIFSMRLKGLHVPQTKRNIKYAVWDKNDLLPAIFELVYFPYFVFKR